MTDNLKQIEWAKKVFWGAFVIAVLSFLCPFADEKTGIGLYIDIFEHVFDKRMDLEAIFILFSLLCIIAWLPIMAYAFRRYTLEKRRYTIDQRLINYFLFAIGFAVYALPTYGYYKNKDVFKIFVWGYWLLLLSMTVVFICYLIIQKEQLIDDDDFSKHLINND